MEIDIVFPDPVHGKSAILEVAMTKEQFKRARENVGPDVPIVRGISHRVEDRYTASYVVGGSED